MKASSQKPIETDADGVRGPGGRSRVRRSRSGWLALAVVVAACGVSEPLEDVRVGVVLETDGVPSVSLPSVVRAGEPFEVSVVTVGGQCVRPGETEVEVERLLAVVTPYDRYGVPRPGIGCLRVDDEIWHTATLQFEEAGLAVVIVRSRAADSEEIRDLEFPVTVSDG